MTSPILVVSSTPGFTELIQITLQDDGRYDPACVGWAEQAIAAAQHNAFAAAILDSDVNDVPLPEAMQTLRQLNPGIRLIVIPPNNDQSHPLLAGLEIDGFLTKPFYIPDLARVLDKLVSLPKDAEPAVPPPPTPPPPQELAPVASKPVSEPVPDWLQDVNRAAQHLARLSLESAAQAALIVRGGQLWAYAGDLPQDAAQELAQQLSRYWNGPRDGQSDLARFIHLQSTDSDYMLYATGLAGSTALALAFNAATPFSKMRAQAANLARALASSTPPAAPPKPSALPAEEVTEPAPPVSPRPMEPKPLEPQAPPQAAMKPELHVSEVAPSAADDEVEIPLLDLGEVPPPMPRREKKFPTEKPTTPTPVNWPTQEPVSLPSASPAFDLNSLPEAVSPDVSAPPRMQAANEWIPAPQTTATERAAERQRHLDTRPLRLEPPSPTVCSLSFACVLVPRLPTHHLVGEIADVLPEMMRQACLAFGWRLEHIAMRPDYLQWLVNVPPSTSASYLMRILRHQLSERLFERFPSLAKDNPSNDFWAPGYLIMSSHQLPPPSVVGEFVANTRRYQGT